MTKDYLNRGIFYNFGYAGDLPTGLDRPVRSAGGTMQQFGTCAGGDNPTLGNIDVSGGQSGGPMCEFLMPKHAPGTGTGQLISLSRIVIDLVLTTYTIKKGTIQAMMTVCSWALSTVQTLPTGKWSILGARKTHKKLLSRCLYFLMNRFELTRADVL